MKNTIRFFAFALVAMGFALNAAAQVTDGAYAEAHIITPLSIEKQVDLDFGNVAVINAIGTIDMDFAAVRTGGGGATPVTNPSGDPTVAEFDITGRAGAQVFVTLPATPPGIEVYHTNGSDHMNVSDFICQPGSGFTLPVGGLQTLLVTAILHTGADQLPGDYHTQADFEVTVNYQ